MRAGQSYGAMLQLDRCCPRVVLHLYDRSVHCSLSLARSHERHCDDVLTCQHQVYPTKLHGKVKEALMGCCVIAAICAGAELHSTGNTGLVQQMTSDDI